MSGAASSLLARSAAAATVILAGPAAAQAVGECDWRARAAAIAEPWEENSRTFANGAIRLAVSYSGEPACCSASLIVLVPDPVVGRACFLVHSGLAAMGGWYAVDLGNATASYDPSRGLLVSVPVEVAGPTGGPDPERADVVDLRIDQAEASVTLE